MYELLLGQFKFYIFAKFEITLSYATFSNNSNISSRWKSAGD